MQKKYIETGQLLLAQISVISGSLILVKLITAILGPAEYGILVLLLSVQVITNQVLFGPLGSACLRFGGESLRLAQFVSFNKALINHFKLIGKTIAVTLAFSLLVLLVLGKENFLLAILCAVYSFVTGVFHSYLQILNSARKRMTYSLILTSHSILQLLFIFLGITVIDNLAITALMGYIVAAIVSTVASIYFVLDLSRHATREPAVVPSNLRISSSIYFDKLKLFSNKTRSWGVFTMLYVASDKWALLAGGSAADVGIYNVSYQFGYTPVAIISGIILQALQPVLYETHSSLDGKVIFGKDMQRNLLLGIVAIAIVAILCSLLSGLVIKVFFHSMPINEASRSSLQLSLAAGFAGCSEVISSILVARSELVKVRNIKIATSISGATACVIGAYTFGIIGVAYAVFLANVFELLLLLSCYVKGSHKGLRSNSPAGSKN